MFLEIETNLTNGPQPDRILINLKKQAISVSVNTYTVYTFDLVGRLITLFDGGYTFRRSLDNRVMQKGSISTNGDTHHVRLWLNLKQRRNLIDQVHERIWRLYHLLKIHRLEVLSATPQDILAVREAIVNALEGILFFDFNQLENEAEIFSSIYGRVGILPPDMYLSILLQATQGCSYNKCSYCNFYKGESYRIKSEGEFLKHIRDVKGFFGGSLPLRKQLFLGEANALDLPQALLLRFFEEINQEFHFKGNSEAESGRPTPPLKGIYSFLSAFHKNRKTSDDFAELQAKHLRRVYIGMETGSNRLLKLMKKPGNSEGVLRVVEAIKRGGANVGVIILLGAGGDRFYDSHIRETVQVIQEMQLGSEDIIFLSPLVQFPGTQYDFDVKEAGIHALDQKGVDTQKTEIKNELGFESGKGSPKMAVYDINEFIY